MFLTVVGALNEGFLQTLKLFLITLIGAIPLGLVVSFGSMSRFSPLRVVTRTFVWIIRGTPLLLQLYIVFYIPGMAMEGGSPWPSGETGRFIASAVTFVVNYSCYFSEIYRGGIQGVPVGQQEAGLVLGMTKRQIFFKITLLQMVKRIVPPMSNEIITLVKDTSLVRVISVYELIWMGETYIKKGLIWPLFYTAVFYLFLSGILTVLLDQFEKKLDYFK